jgi:hypothetical protein
MPSSVRAFVERTDAERVIRLAHARVRILVPARDARCAVGGSMSLYRAGLKLAFFLPLGVAMPPASFGRRQGSPM